MTDQGEHETVTEDDDEGDEGAAEVEGFGAINTTRDNIKRPGAMTTAPGIAGVGPSQFAIKEQGIK